MDFIGITHIHQVTTIPQHLQFPRWNSAHFRPPGLNLSPIPLFLLPSKGRHHYFSIQLSTLPRLRYRWFRLPCRHWHIGLLLHLQKSWHLLRVCPCMILFLQRFTIGGVNPRRGVGSRQLWLRGSRRSWIRIKWRRWRCMPLVGSSEYRSLYVVFPYWVVVAVHNFSSNQLATTNISFWISVIHKHRYSLLRLCTPSWLIYRLSRYPLPHLSSVLESHSAIYKIYPCWHEEHDLARSFCDVCMVPPLQWILISFFSRDA